MLVDSNGPVSPAGSKTLNVVGTYSSDVWSTVIASFKSAAEYVPNQEINFDNASSADSAEATATLTFSHAVSTTGTNRVLFVGVSAWNSATPGVTFNGNSLTLVGSDHETYNNSYAHLFYLVAPDTGTHDVVVTLPNANNYIHATAASYTGASQIGVPDASAHSNGAALTYSQSVTTGTDNSWVVMMANNGNGRMTGVDSGTTQRGTDLGSVGMLVDSNGPVSPAGSKTLNVVGTYSSDGGPPLSRRLNRKGTSGENLYYILGKSDQQNSPTRGCFCFLIHFRVYGWGCSMAYYKVRIEVWCDWNPAESDLEDIAQSMGVGEAICTMREVVAVVNRPQDIEDEEAMSFFGGSEGDADESQG